MRLLLPFLILGSLCAQPPARFEVAAIRPSPPITPELLRDGLPIGMRIVDGRLTIGFVTMGGLIQWAYEVKDHQISGPPWINEQRFHIDATFPPGMGKEQFPTLLRTLLEDRFAIKIRREQRENSVYLLTRSPEFKVKASEPPLEAARESGGVIPTTVAKTPTGEAFSSEQGIMRRTSGPNGLHIEWDRISLPDYAAMLASALGQPVLDRTGLQGSYPLFVDYPVLPSQQDPAGRDVAAQADLVGTVTASVRSLGLRLDQGKASMDHIVIESIERMPSEN